MQLLVVQQLEPTAMMLPLFSLAFSFCTPTCKCHCCIHLFDTSSLSRLLTPASHWFNQWQGFPNVVLLCVSFGERGVEPLSVHGVENKYQ